MTASVLTALADVGSRGSPVHVSGDVKKESSQAAGNKSDRSRCCGDIAADDRVNTTPAFGDHTLLYVAKDRNHSASEPSSQIASACASALAFTSAMGQDQPFIYDPPADRHSVTYPHSDFNPRAATQAHYAAFAERAERNKLKSQQKGPLIDFNAHPDSFSYMIVPTQTIEHTPLPANAAKNIIWTRWVQFGLRIVQELGALGILVCVICLKMKSDAVAWMIRVAVSSVQGLPHSS